jgi:hypothetical protein
MLLILLYCIMVQYKKGGADEEKNGLFGSVQIVGEFSAGRTDKTIPAIVWVEG